MTKIATLFQFAGRNGWTEIRGGCGYVFHGPNREGLLASASLTSTQMNKRSLPQFSNVGGSSVNDAGFARARLPGNVVVVLGVLRLLLANRAAVQAITLLLVFTFSSVLANIPRDPPGEVKDAPKSSAAAVRDQEVEQERSKEGFPGRYVKPAESGDAKAQYMLGVCYDLGVGVSQDYVTAARWYTKAATQGHPRAQHHLATLYSEGRGMVRDQTQAFEWYRKAAEQGLAEAQFDLGLSYAHAEGVTTNHQEAVKWYQKAAEQGYGPAEMNLGNAYARGLGVATNATQALAWWRKAAAHRIPEAGFAIGIYYLDPTCGNNSKDGLQWLRAGAEGGCQR